MAPQFENGKIEDKEVDPTTSIPFRSAITSYITSLYNGSNAFASLLDSSIRSINIADSVAGYPGFSAAPTVTASGKAYDGFVAYDFATTAMVGYFNTSGTWVPEKPEITVAHELVHQFNENARTDPSGDVAVQNGANFDFYGEVTRAQNVISTQMGYADHIQAGYTAGGLLSMFATGQNYTSGQPIDVARFGYGSDNDMFDASARIDTLNFLMFGMDGDDTIKGGKGNDHLYGGAGNDQLSGGDGNDHLYGGAGRDTLNGGAGGDHLDGGDGNDLINTGKGGVFQGTIPPDDAFDEILGGGGNDVISVRTAFVSISGGAGDDQFWFHNGFGGYFARITDADAGDKVYWNGYQAVGGTMSLLDYHQLGSRSVEYDLAATDQDGFVYHWHVFGGEFGAGSQLQITFPDGLTVTLPGFQSGDAGIFIDQPDNDVNVDFVFDDQGMLTGVNTAVPITPIAGDDRYLNLLDLPGAQYALDHYGPVVEPIFPLM